MSTKSEISPNSPSSLVPPVSETRNRHRRYQEGSLVSERRKECSHERRTRCPHCVWVYRFFQYFNEKKTRRKVILGTVEQFPTKDDAKRACEHHRMSANAENPRRNVTMPGLIQLYTEKILRPCLSVPIGGIQDPNAPMGFKCADSYRGQLRNRIMGRWRDYSVSDFERPEIWWEAQEWFQSLVLSPNNPSGLAPKTVRLIYATMGQLTKYAVKWGYLSQNPFAGKAGQGRRIDPPRGSTLRLTKANQLTPEQCARLASHLSLPLRARAAVTISWWLEPRGSETFGFKWMDFDFNAAVVSFRRGLDAGRITHGKTSASCTEMPLPREVLQVLREWRSSTPYNQPHDWVFASPQKEGKIPISRYGLMKDHIQPIARELGLPHVTWYSFRHSLNALAKECLSREERQIMLRHRQAPAASEDGYGEVPLERKREIAQRLWTRMRERLGAAVIIPYANLPKSATGQNERNLSAGPSQLPMAEPSALAFGDRAAIPVLSEPDATLALKRLEHEKRSASARKAWVTIHANSAAKKAAAPQERRDPRLTQNSKNRVA